MRRFTEGLLAWFCLWAGTLWPRQGGAGVALEMNPVKFCELEENKTKSKGYDHDMMMVTFVKRPTITLLLPPPPPLSPAEAKSLLHRSPSQSHTWIVYKMVRIRILMMLMVTTTMRAVMMIKLLTTPTPPSSKGSVLHFMLASSVSKEQSRNITTSPFGEVSACVFSWYHHNVVGADGNPKITQNHNLLFKMAGNQESVVKAWIFLKINTGWIWSSPSLKFSSPFVIKHPRL